VGHRISRQLSPGTFSCGVSAGNASGDHRLGGVAAAVVHPTPAGTQLTSAEESGNGFARGRDDLAPLVTPGPTLGVVHEWVDLEENLRSLLDRAKSGDHYRAPPVRRVHIPKDGKHKTRPIGVPTFEDKVLQRSVAMVLDAVYEQDFLDCSYGFRPGRSPHQAVRAVWKQAMDMGGCWVLEVDIEDFFGSLDQTRLREILRQRIRDGVLLRLIDKWLNAGVMEEGCVYHPETGVPQGEVISPILSNVYLHEVLDRWFTEQVRPRLRGRA